MGNGSGDGDEEAQGRRIYRALDRRRGGGGDRLQVSLIGSHVKPPVVRCFVSGKRRLQNRNAVAREGVGENFVGHLPALGSHLATDRMTGFENMMKKERWKKEWKKRRKGKETWKRRAEGKIERKHRKKR